MSDTQLFELDSTFLHKFKGKQPVWGPLGYITYKRTYARKLDNGSFEEFWQTLKRVVEGTYRIQQKHCSGLRLPWSNTKAQNSAQEMFTRMWDFKFLPPGRGLWAMGSPIVEKIGSAALNNCGFASSADLKTSFSAPFCFLMDMSMLGVGVGGDTRGAGTITIRRPFTSKDTYVVPDTREGWVDLIRVILDSYVRDAAQPETIDYSLVRPLGAAINGFGGTASGPGPLIELVQSIKDILNPLIGLKITSTAIVDLFNVIGRCVVAGNVRRSAEIMLGDPDDQKFLELKDSDKHGKELEHHRWASNNSIFATVGMDYKNVAARTASNGEPGYFWLDNARAYSRMGHPADWKDAAVVGTNPCSEQSLWDRELCNLVETFPAHHDDIDDYKRTLKFAYLYAKTVTLIPTHDVRTNAVMLQNRRIGTSQSGIIQAINKFGLRAYFQLCDVGYDYLNKIDKTYSNWLCVPESIKKTSVKPSGTVSLLPGATPGMHYPHSEYYIRNIRCEKNSQIVKTLAKAGFPVADDVYTPNTSVVSVPVHESHYTKGKTDITMWEQLELTAQIQHHWADNQVSVTVSFKPDEVKDMERALEFYETRLKSVSFLPLDGGGYKQAPYIEITKAEYNKMASKLKPYDLSTIMHDTTDAFCDGDKCMLPNKTVA